MPWFRVDDNLAFHAKAIAAGNAAMGLWVRAGAWAMQQLTDGEIPRHMAQQMGTRGEIKRLVDSGPGLPVPRMGRPPAQQGRRDPRSGSQGRGRSARQPPPLAQAPRREGPGLRVVLGGRRMIARLSHDAMRIRIAPESQTHRPSRPVPTRPISVVTVT
jgi:hypothetical protein